MSQSNQQIILPAQKNRGVVTFTNSGSFVVPAGVTTINAACIGGGASGLACVGYTPSLGGGGGAAAYSNYISVTPGETLTITVGAGGNNSSGGDSTVKRGATVLVKAAGGGTDSGLRYTGGSASDCVGSVAYSGGRGEAGAYQSDDSTYYASLAGGGGGAAGFTAAGGTGGVGSTSGGASTSSTSGGGGGGGAKAGGTILLHSSGSGGGGGGSNFKAVSQGNGGSSSLYSGGGGGGGGSGGTAGSAGSYSGSSSSINLTGGAGGSYGGGGGGGTVSSPDTYRGGQGGKGVVILCWGPGRTFPTNWESITPNIEHLGSNTSTSDSVAIATHSAGDLIVVWAFSAGSSIIRPQTPDGSWVGASVGANSCGFTFAYKWATSSGTTSGTWAYASAMISMVFRNVQSIDTNIVYGSAANGTAAYPALTLGSPMTPSNKIVACGASRSITSSIETPPAGTELLTSVLDSDCELSAFASIGSLGSWPGETVSIGGGSTGSWAAVLELKGY